MTTGFILRNINYFCMDTRTYIWFIVLIVFFSPMASAESLTDAASDFFSGLIKTLIDFISKLLGYSGEDSQQQVVCNPPYIRFSSSCCLDSNGNSICDRDEASSTTTSTTTSSSTTTSTTSTTTSTSSTTLPSIACWRNRDCGEEKEVKICYRGDVYIQKINPICRMAGKPESYCVNYTSLAGASMLSEPVPFERCSQGCLNGACL